MSTNKTTVEKNLQEKSFLVAREFQAPLADVWRAYTEAALLDQWWGPAPWRAMTKHMDFRPGGYWLYAMVGPNGEKHWGRMNYTAIDHHKSYDLEDAFCDENGVVNASLPAARGRNSFASTTSGTRVEFKMFYPSEEALKQVLEMGMEQGITMCMDQLEVILSKR